MFLAQCLKRSCNSSHCELFWLLGYDEHLCHVCMGVYPSWGRIRAVQKSKKCSLYPVFLSFQPLKNPYVYSKQKWSILVLFWKLAIIVICILALRFFFHFLIPSYRFLSFSVKYPVGKVWQIRQNNFTWLFLTSLSLTVLLHKLALWGWLTLCYVFILSERIWVVKQHWTTRKLWSFQMLSF